MTTSPRQNLTGNFTQDDIAYLWATTAMTANMTNIYAAGRILVHEMSFSWTKDELIELAQELGKLYCLCREAIREGIIPEPWLSSYCGRPQQEGIDILFHEDGGFHVGIHADIEGYNGSHRGYIHSTGKFRYEDSDDHIKCKTWPELAKLLRERA